MILFSHSNVRKHLSLLSKVACMLMMLNVFSVAQARDKSARVEEAITIYNDVMRQLDLNYVDTLPYAKLTETAINQMLRQLDPYTVYYPKERDNDLKRMTTGKYGGVGAVIQQRSDTLHRPHKRYVIISEPYEGMPAQKAGLMAGDRILEIDGKKMEDKQVSEVSEMLRGIPHSTLTIKVKRDGVDDPMVFTIEREEIKLPAVSYYGMLNDTVAYIYFSEFTEHSAAAFSQAMDELVREHGAKSVVIDLRNNGGGIIDEAVKIVNLFVDKGTRVVSTRGNKHQPERIYCTTQNAPYADMPIALLVNHNSASASEIVAGSLQDLHRATLIGERTFGKGLVQSVRSVSYDGYIKLTTAKYYLPSGRCIQAIDYSKHEGTAERDTAGGILPDIVIADSSMKVDICYTLYSTELFFDYATYYRSQHESIAPAKSFALSDADIEDFCDYLATKNFVYETETSKYFAEMLDMAMHEDIDSATIDALKAIEPHLRPSYRDAIMRHKDEIKKILEAEIVERYYYMHGRIENVLRHDESVQKALSIL